MYAERKILEALERGDQAQADYWARIKAKVDEAPPLTVAQRDQLAVLLRPFLLPASGASVAA